MPADAEDVVRTLRMLIRNGEGEVACIEAYEEAADLIERQSAEIAKLQAERNAYESPAWEANERLNAKCEEAWAEIATLRAQVAGLEAEVERVSRLGGIMPACSPTPAPDASPQSAHPTNGRTT